MSSAAKTSSALAAYSPSPFASPSPLGGLVTMIESETKSSCAIGMAVLRPISNVSWAGNASAASMARLSVQAALATNGTRNNKCSPPPSVECVKAPVSSTNPGVAMLPLRPFEKGATCTIGPVTEARLEL